MIVLTYIYDEVSFIKASRAHSLNGLTNPLRNSITRPRMAFGPWLLLAPPVLLLDAFWLLLCWLLLAPPGSSSPLLAPPGSSWLVLASAGSSWLILCFSRGPLGASRGPRVQVLSSSPLLADSSPTCRSTLLKPCQLVLTMPNMEPHGGLRGPLLPWLLLAPPGSPLLLLGLPGSSCAFLASAGSSLLLLAPSGAFWLLLAPPFRVHWLSCGPWLVGAGGEWHLDPPWGPERPSLMIQAYQG